MDDGRRMGLRSATTSRPEFASGFTVWSKLAEAMRRPSGEKPRPRPRPRDRAR